MSSSYLSKKNSNIYFKKFVFPLISDKNKRKTKNKIVQINISRSKIYLSHQWSFFLEKI